MDIQTALIDWDILIIVSQAAADCYGRGYTADTEKTPSGKRVRAALVFLPAMALAGDLSPSGRSSETLSVITMSFGLGIAVGPLVSGILVTHGFALPFLLGATLAGIGAVLVIIHVDEPSRDPPGWERLSDRIG